MLHEFALTLPHMVLFRHGVSKKVSCTVILFIYFLSLFLACPTHTNLPGSGIGTGGAFIKKHSYIFFAMKLAVTHSIYILALLFIS